MSELAAVVDSFSASDLSVRVPSGLFSVLPFAPAWTHPGTLLDQAGSARAAELAAEVARGDGAQRALQVFDLLDKADAGIAIFSGLRGAVKAYKGEDGAWEVDPQQATDAAVKALGVAWAAYALFDGQVSRLTEYKSGRALLAWYVSADLVLPFADNAAEGGVAMFTGIIDRYTPAASEKLAAMAGPDAAKAAGALAAMKDTVGGLAAQATVAAGPMSEWARNKLPGVIGTADTVTGAIATALDTLAAYRYLGTALVAEVCVAEGKARAESEARAAAEAAEAARQAAEAARVAAEAARRAEEEAQRKASAQREDYSLDASQPAASLASAPIKTTRNAEVEARAEAPVAKSGCFGCGGLLLLGLAAAASGAAYALGL
ncbi:MAG: hypothetical protein FJ102_12340 [Deltaproteobacteria bacterium]|nr:hypothetical protein [Deltaproteobacteria bacterium]